MASRYVDYSRYAGWGGAAPAPSAASCAPASWSGGAPVASRPGLVDEAAAGIPQAAPGSVRAASDGAQASGRGDRPARPGALAAFWLLYESRDRRLGLFETRDGHLAAVDPARLV